MLQKKRKNTWSAQLAENQLLKALTDIEHEGKTQEEKHKNRKNMLVAYILDTHM